MKISTKGRYGLLAMIDIAAHQSQGSVSLRSVAQRTNLSENYLEQLLSTLRKAGLVTSTRGAQGGYVLARSPDSITMGDILRELEGSMSPVGCLEPSEASEATPKCDSCVTRPVWEKLYNSLNNILDNTKLSDLAGEYSTQAHKEESLCQN
ncbi:MAG: Rrf2 family transcriptional regulator [Defluviitaleaceae bacterium]|nr:Rrf2 family transcriptional regulator [Defluviitaleaceae bacterium]